MVKLNPDVEFALGIVGAIMACLASPYLFDFGLMAMQHPASPASVQMCVVLLVLACTTTTS